MISIKKLLVSTFLISAAFSFALVAEKKYDHYDYANDLGLDHHYGHHHHHLEQHKIHEHLHSNTKKLDQIHTLLKHNNMHNHKQDQILKKHTELIKQQIDMQKADADRDDTQMMKLNNAVYQRKDIKDSVDVNTELLGNVKDSQNIMIFNQNKMGMKMKKIKMKENKIMDNVQLNNAALHGLHHKMDAHDVNFNIHSINLLNHMDNANKHDAKQNALIVNQAAHDARQSEIMGQVLVNQDKLNQSKAGQLLTQGMIAAHDAKLEKHDENVAAFASEQLTFNDKVETHQGIKYDHMARENIHKADQRNHMNNEKIHMKMEALHMAEADEYMNHGHHHHRHRRVIRLVRPAPALLVGKSN